MFYPVTVDSAVLPTQVIVSENTECAQIQLDIRSLEGKSIAGIRIANVQVFNIAVCVFAGRNYAHYFDFRCGGKYWYPTARPV